MRTCYEKEWRRGRECYKKNHDKGNDSARDNKELKMWKEKEEEKE